MPGQHSRICSGLHPMVQSAAGRMGCGGNTPRACLHRCTCKTTLSRRRRSPQAWAWQPWRNQSSLWVQSGSTVQCLSGLVADRRLPGKEPLYTDGAWRGWTPSQNMCMFMLETDSGCLRRKAQCRRGWRRR